MDGVVDEESWQKLIQQCSYLPQHAFLPGNDRTISILGDDGGLFFLKVSAKRPKIKVEIGDRGRTITAFDVECHARYLAACTRYSAFSQF